MFLFLEQDSRLGAASARGETSPEGDAVTCCGAGDGSPDEPHSTGSQHTATKTKESQEEEGAPAQGHVKVTTYFRTTHTCWAGKRTLPAELG